MADLLKSVLHAEQHLVQTFGDGVDEEDADSAALLELEELLATQVREQLASKTKRPMGTVARKLAKRQPKRAVSAAGGGGDGSAGFAGPPAGGKPPAGDAASSAGGEAAASSASAGGAKQRAKTDAHMFHRGPFEFKTLRSGRTVTGVSAECHCHSTPGDANQCARSLTATGGFDEARCIVHLERWLCLGCALDCDDKATHMSNQMAPRKLSGCLSAEERRAAIASSDAWSDLEREEIESL